MTKQNNIKNFIIFDLLLLIEEILFKISMGMTPFDWTTLRIFIGLTIFSGLITLLLSFINKTISNIIRSILLLAASIIAIVQGGMFNYFGTYMSLGTASQAGAVGYFVSDFMTNIKPLQYLILLPAIIYIIGLIVSSIINKKKLENTQELKLKAWDTDAKKNKKNKYDDSDIVDEDILELTREFNPDMLKKVEKKENLNKKQPSNLITRLSILIITIICIPLYYVSLNIDFMQNSLQMVKNNILFNNPSMPNIAVNQFGILGYEFVDIKTLIFGAVEEDITFTKQNQEKTDYSRNIDDTAWESANATETNSDYKKLNEYFMSKTITDKNEYTGLLEGKNVIFIMMESGSNVLLDYPEYFPNINKLYNEGWSWTNAFSPRNSCSTGNNEMTGLTSLYTINDTCTINTYQNNTYFEALFNLYNYKGYQTQSYHDYTDHFYARSVYHPNMGSQKYRDVKELGITLGSEYQPWPSDVEFIEKATPTYINEDKFMTWMTTVSSHMTYNSSSVTGDMYLSKFKDENWSTPVKRYMSKLTILDNAIGELLDELEASGKLDDTVIVLYADHYPYGLGESLFSEVAKYDVSSYGDIDRTPFIIYNPSLEPTKYDEYTTFVNILPTIANLMNLDYDPRLYGGTDLLSSDYENVAVFADGSWRSDIAYYDATKGKLTYFGDEKYTDQEVLEINTRIKNEIKMDNLAIEKNYFKYLGEILGKEVLDSPYIETSSNENS